MGVNEMKWNEMEEMRELKCKKRFEREREREVGREGKIRWEGNEREKNIKDKKKSQIYQESFGRIGKMRLKHICINKVRLNGTQRKGTAELNGETHKQRITYT